MFSLLNFVPGGLAAKILACALAVGLIFGAGFYTAVRVESGGVQRAVAAQEKVDVQKHKDALAENKKVQAGDIAHALKVIRITNTIHDQAAPASCDLTQEDAQALNDAAKF